MKTNQSQKWGFSMKELTLEEFDAMFQIMQESFPITEMRTYKEQKRLFEREDYHVYGFYEQNQLIGFLAIYEEKNFTFIEHFALTSAVRGKGYGSRILQQFISTLKKPSIFEVEYPTTEIAKRRIRLYQRLGAKLFDEIDYAMPPLHQEHEPLPLYLMTFNKQLQEVDVVDMIPDIYKYVYRVEFTWKGNE